LRKECDVVIAADADQGMQGCGGVGLLCVRLDWYADQEPEAAQGAQLNEFASGDFGHFSAPFSGLAVMETRAERSWFILGGLGLHNRKIGVLHVLPVILYFPCWTNRPVAAALGLFLFVVRTKVPW
jgi:hypothetical protein